ncbi:MAG: hypothetical protein PHO63_01275 [Bacilli bacterium]|nr:hypothetical protein [Bacilli bacterium]MDD4809324.1 hypothetical protein [Bacilli bacterium]
MSILEYTKKHRKMIILVTVILLSPFIIPLVTTLIEMLYIYGTYIGTFIRTIKEGVICY